MKRSLSPKQKEYRVYLASRHWVGLRALALERDGGKCVVCETTEHLQVHHKLYRDRLEDSVLDDLETLCRTCHRQEHGIGPTVFEMKLKAANRKLTRNTFPTPAEEKELAELAVIFEGRDDVEAFFRLVAGYRMSSSMWSLWIKKDRSVTDRFWHWSQSKFDRLVNT